MAPVKVNRRDPRRSFLQEALTVGHVILLMIENNCVCIVYSVAQSVYNCQQ